ncbi:predicted protein [Histoplasma capsulatum G186AR]|uniref:Uncharacterized protein n=1 Tax=Ajellomyces capsulatus (strain G186AR / H82 / ATCC MYA-2454 / RMSCC 2432) TaxID=447093 RepID=C0NAQ9_AJECG|nr:uncharacterized protein HCBG_00205 [Histoplasma capsulatum G186AR]EEH10750.1 predicted protein [Histoplasma capsulatum G186AR]
MQAGYNSRLLYETCRAERRLVTGSERGTRTLALQQAGHGWKVERWTRPGIGTDWLWWFIVAEVVVRVVIIAVPGGAMTVEREEEETTAGDEYKPTEHGDDGGDEDDEDDEDEEG